MLLSIPVCYFRLNSRKLACVKSKLDTAKYAKSKFNFKSDSTIELKCIRLKKLSESKMNRV